MGVFALTYARNLSGSGVVVGVGARDRLDLFDGLDPVFARSQRVAAVVRQRELGVFIDDLGARGIEILPLVRLTVCCYGRSPVVQRQRRYVERLAVVQLSCASVGVRDVVLQLRTERDLVRQRGGSESIRSGERTEEIIHGDLIGGLVVFPRSDGGAVIAPNEGAAVSRVGTEVALRLIAEREPGILLQVILCRNLQSESVVFDRHFYGVIAVAAHRIELVPFSRIAGVVDARLELEIVAVRYVFVQIVIAERICDLRRRLQVRGVDQDRKFSV